MNEMSSVKNYWQLSKEACRWIGPAFWQASPFVLLAVVVAATFVLLGLVTAFGLASLIGGNLPLIICFLFVLLALLSSCYFFAGIIQKLWALLNKQSPMQREFWALALRKTASVFFAMFFMNVIILAVDLIFIILSLNSGSLWIQIISTIVAAIIVTYLSIKLVFWSTVIVLEDSSLMNAMWRSWQLTNNNFWLVAIVLGLVIGIPALVLWAIAALGSLLGVFIPLLVSMASVLIMPTITFVAILQTYKYLLTQNNNTKGFTSG